MNQMVSRKRVRAEDIIATIKRSVGSNGRWLIIANAAAEGRESGAWRGEYPSQTEWLNAAAKEAGVTANTLRRMISAAEFLRAVSPTAYQESLKGSPQAPKLVYGTVELIKRMHDISPEAGRKALVAHLADKLSARAAKEQYDLFCGGGGPDLILTSPPYSNVDPAKIGSRRAHAKRSKIRGLVESHIESMSDVDPFSSSVSVSLLDRFHFDYVRPDVAAVAKTAGKPKFVDGFDYQSLPTEWQKVDIRKTVRDVAFNSSFFRRYWVIVDSTPQDAERFSNSIAELSLNNVGVALLNHSKQDVLEFVRTPTKAPIPDRQKITLNMIPREE